MPSHAGRQVRSGPTTPERAGGGAAACTDTHTGMYTHICTHTYEHTHIHTCMLACWHACMQACRHACIHASMHACMHAYMYDACNMHVCMHGMVGVCISACIPEVERPSVQVRQLRVAHLKLNQPKPSTNHPRTHACTAPHDPAARKRHSHGRARL